MLGPTVVLTDEAATMRFATRLAPVLRAGDVVALHGDLGAGKTAFARALVRARTGEADAEVPSPTFTLVQTYETGAPAGPLVWHFDVYRLTDPEEALALDIEDAFALGISLVEWPERLGLFLPADRLDLVLRIRQDPSDSLGREARLSGRGRWAARLPPDRRATLREAFPWP